MTDDKRNRIIGAVTVNLILLLVIFAAVVIYQLVYISILTRRREDIQSQIDYYIEQIETEENNLDYLKSLEERGDMVELIIALDKLGIKIENNNGN